MKGWSLSIKTGFGFLPSFTPGLFPWMQSPVPVAKPEFPGFDERFFPG